MARDPSNPPPLPDWPALEELGQAIQEGERRDLSGLWGSARALVAAELARRIERELWLVTPTQGAAERLHRDLDFFLGTREVRIPKPGGKGLKGRYLQRRRLVGRAILLPPACDAPYAYQALTDRRRRERLRSLYRLSHQRPRVVVTSVDALLTRCPGPETIHRRCLEIRVGHRIGRENLIRYLDRSGYRRVDLVTEPGEYRTRGGLLDLHSPALPLPVRVELGGDRIETLREFDPDTQRSVIQVEELVLIPASEAPGWKKIRPYAETVLGEMQSRGEVTRRRLAEILDRMDAGGTGLDPDLRHYFAPDLTSAWDWVPSEAAVCLLGGEEVLQAARRHRLLAEREWTDRTASGVPAPSPDILYDGVDRLSAELQQRAGGSWEPLERGREGEIVLEVRSVPAYGGNVRSLVRDLLDQGDQGGEVWLVSRTELAAERLRDVLADTHAAEMMDRTGGSGPGRLRLLVGELSGGFELTSIRRTILAESDLFGERITRRRESRAGAPGLSLRELSEGDLVVHADHGIGEYSGLIRLEVEGLERDMLLVRYAGSARLYVPVHQIHKVQRYVSPGKARPKLDKMGGTAWGRTKTKAKEAVYRYAAELLRIYAARQVASGHAFPEDSAWQKEFELGFPYQETPDQRRAILDVKADMRAQRPMDRLICGDVGYGKTEVAMRAAFKAVDGGRQVAVLAPTTVLVQQHYESFRRRFRPFPVEVGMLSRFVSGSQEKEVLEQLEAGKIDIVIGTHRILSQDVRFRELGLLVVDEEQRFGVRHKERLKQLRASVDILTLTATPIPRTLQMAHFGIRDLSLIHTAPEDRLPIRTRIAKFAPVLIRDMIQRELDRGGQVYVVHNRVRSIYSLARLVQRLAPAARVAVGHGQMPPAELERVMGDFAQRRYDVLVATTIIESGLDIPTVNTIVVNRADHFGLAQLYQLRGRVGRDRFQAHALLLVPGLEAITQDARKRLQALQRYTALGSGYQVAMEDLEIRGAGELLGAKQSGQLAAVGFHLYSQLMEQAVRDLQGQTALPGFEVDLKVRADMGLPPEFVPEASLRVDFYRRLGETGNRLELQALAEELADRYGELPDPTRTLVVVHRLRLECQRLRIGRARVDSGSASLAFAPDTPADPVVLTGWIRDEPERFALGAGGSNLRITGGWASPEAALEAVGRLLEQLG